MLFDFFCCQGGASKGYADAGFCVAGGDLEPQPRYPFEFLQSDAIRDFDALIEIYRPAVVVGSPPCQGYSAAQVIQGREHPKLISQFRDRCKASGLPYVIENVEGARDELIAPERLCGLMFGLQTDRHRLFETGGASVFPCRSTRGPGLNPGRITAICRKPRWDARSSMASYASTWATSTDRLPRASISEFPG